MKTLHSTIARGVIAGVMGALMVSACGGSFANREADAYKVDTRELLTSHNQKVKSCYDGMLAQDESASGVVVVNFKVKAETGAVAEAAVDEAETTAPEGLSDCVLGTLNGLFLDPADSNDGHATFRWNFTPGS